MKNKKLGERFEQAFQLAFQLHRKQSRKGTNIPYISHLLSVAALVLEDGGDEDLAIAALLHDSVEDQGGLRTLDKINKMFGNRVSTIVAGCSDSWTKIKPAWRKRKEDYIKKLIEEGDDVIKVSLADKVHNARSIKRDLLYEGKKTWDRFTGGKEGTLWYYSALLDVYRKKIFSPLVNELSELIQQLRMISIEEEN